MAAVPSIGRAARVEGAALPEADATHALYEQYGSQVFRYCLHQLGSREDAEDAVQSTFLNAFRGIRRGAAPALESAWLFKIAHNVCLTRRRSTWRRGRIESPADFELVEELAAAPSRYSDELIGLEDVLERMPERQRRAILLREWRGLTYREIAAELQLSQAAVEALIFRARRTLARGLEQPPRGRRHRFHGAFATNMAGTVKAALVSGSVGAKIAATVAVVSATTIVVTVPLQTNRARPNATAAHAVAPAPVAARSTGVTPARLRPPRVLHGHAAPARRSTAKRAVAPSPRPVPRAVVPPVAPAESRPLKSLPPDTTPIAHPVREDAPVPEPNATEPVVDGLPQLDESEPSAAAIGPSEPLSAAIAAAYAAAAPAAALPLVDPAAAPMETTPWVPPGQLAVPRGQATVPPGQAAVPPGQASTPPGQASAPPGRASTPPGQASMPQGQASVPPGQATTPPGQVKTQSAASQEDAADTESSTGADVTAPSAPAEAIPDAAVPPVASELADGSAAPAAAQSDDSGDGDVSGQSQQ